MRILNVAEKNDAAKRISSILSQDKFKKTPGASVYNWIYEFQMQFQGMQVTMVVTSVTGHLMNMELDPAYKAWHSCDPCTLMNVSTNVVKEVTPESENVAKTLQSEARKAQRLFLWLDGDREGENIAFEVIQCCTQANRTLSTQNGTIKRARFSEFTNRAVTHALNNLGPPDEKLSMAVEARQELDLRLGAAFTRWQTLLLRQNFSNLPANLISYGPCQFPTLGFVVQRYLRRKNFVSEPYWSLNVTYKKDNKTAFFTWKRGRLYNRMACIVLFEIVMENPMATVQSIVKKEQRRWRPVPLNTVEMQKWASKKLHMSPHKAMNVAEALYSKGFISYPRTETDFYTLNDQELKLIIREQEQDGTWGGYATRLLNGEFRMPRKGKNNDNAHPPIHPTKSPTGDLSNDEKNLYELITRHFLATCSDDAIGHETVVTINIANELFHAKGLMISRLNWLEIFKYERWTDKDMPLFTENEQFEPTEIKMTDGATQPPPLLTDSDLVSLMDKNGIGTDATIAQHIETIQKRHYAVKKGNVFEPTNLGLALIEGYDSMGFDLSKPNLRAKMEAEMTEISRGTKTKDVVVFNNLQMYEFILKDAMKKADLLEQAVAKYYKGLGQGTAKILEKNFSACGRCNGLMHMKMQNENKFLHCQDCSQTHKVPTNGELSANDHRCPICNFQVLNVLNTSTNKTHTICPFCFNHPPDLEDLAGPTHNGFRCFQCTWDCPLAAKKRSDQPPIARCPTCKSDVLTLRDNKEGTRKFIGCKGFPRCRHCIFLPTAERIQVLDERCSNCSTHANPVRKMEFAFTPGQHNQTGRLAGCIFCDAHMKDLVSVAASKPTTPPTGGVAIGQRSPTKRQRMMTDIQAGKQKTLDTMLTKRRRFEGQDNSAQTSTATVNRTYPRPQDQQQVVGRSSNWNPNNNNTRTFTAQQTNNRQLQMQSGNNAMRTNMGGSNGYGSNNNNGNYRSNPHSNYAANNSANHNNNGDNDGPIVCFCGEPARVLTSKTEKTMGRQFAKCPKQQNEQCKFFKWLDE